MANLRPVKGTLGVIRAGVALLTRREASVMVALFGATAIVGLLDAAVVVLVLPLVQSIVQPESLQTSALFGRASAWLGFEWNTTVVPWLAALLIGLISISAVATMYLNWLGDRQAAYCRNRLGNELVQRLLEAPYPWLVGKNTAVLARLVLTDIAIWRNNFLQSLLHIGQSLLLIIMPSATVIALVPSSGMLILAVVGALGLAATWIVRPHIQKTADLQKENMNSTWRELLQFLTGIREIKVSNRALFFSNRIERCLTLGNHYLVTNRFLVSLSPSVILTLGQVGFILAAMLLWADGLPGAEVAAQLGMLGVVVTRVIPLINRVSNNFNTLVASIPFMKGLLDTLREINDAKRDHCQHVGGEPVPRDWGTVKFENVHFQYPGATVASLNGLDFELKRGKRYGLVGQSGAGKSTIVNLLLGLLHPTEGIISVDGRPLSTIEIGQWQERIGYVPQEPFLLDDSLRSNIVFGDSVGAEKDDRLLDAVHQAHLSEIVSSLPKGLETWIGERGRRVSGGQIQRVAIARALYRSPDIVLLDEATSALDSITEGEIKASFDALGENVLAVAVAHRVSSLRDCHFIIVLCGGQVQDMGGYDELLERNALFRDLAAQPPGRVAW